MNLEDVDHLVNERLAAVDAELAQRGYRVLIDHNKHSSTVTLVDCRGHRRGGLEAIDVLTFCQMDALQRVYPWIKGAYATTGTEIDQALHGEGLGTLMYERTLLDLARRGLALAPHDCAERVQLSAAAEGVWRKLRRMYPHAGRVVAGVPAR